MGKARQTPIYIWGGMILVSLGMSVPSLSFGELLSTVSVGEKTTKTKSSPKENKKAVMAFPSGPTGFRAEEVEVEQAADHLLSLQRSLSTKEQELVETTDASGGTMINLQGRFRSVLTVSDESMDSPVEEPLSPAIP